jgi:NADH dehydrogenase
MPARIVILGGGFAGLATARELERLLRPSEAELTLVSRENFSVFTPMLPEVSSGNLESRHIVTPVRAQLRRTQFVLGEVDAIDLEQKRVAVRHVILGTRRTYEYDQLVLALGADADRLRNHVIAMLELADVTADPAQRQRLLRFVFVGGGFTGVEAAGEMVDLFRSTLRFYRSIAPHEVEIYLVEGGKKLLPELQAGMGEYSARALGRRGVRVLLESMVAEADHDGLTVKGGRHLSTATLVWSAGVRPSPSIAALSIASGRGRSIPTSADMSVPGYPGLWALGDCASIPAPAGGTYPPTAQHALREGPWLAHNIAATLRGSATKTFRYDALGMMASLGGRRGVAGLRGRFLLTGFLAWMLWRTYYLLRLPGLDRRVRVALDWTLGLLFPRDISELRVYTESARLHSLLEAGLKPVRAAPEEEA